MSEVTVSPEVPPHWTMPGSCRITGLKSGFNRRAYTIRACLQDVSPFVSTKGCFTASQCWLTGLEA